MNRSVYFTAEEAQELQAYAEAQATAVNFVVRMAVRYLLGLPVPAGMLAAMQEQRVARDWTRARASRG